MTSQRFFDRVRSGQFIVLLSDQTIRELEKAPKEVISVWKNLPTDAVEFLVPSPEVQSLAFAYIDANVLKLTSEADALQVAAATISAADLILSGNFKQLTFALFGS